jgi:signal transduction histidine kinase
LSFVKALVERMGGRIGFEAAETCGTTFYFELPARLCMPDRLVAT